MKLQHGPIIIEKPILLKRLELNSFKEEKFLMGRDLEFAEFQQLAIDGINDKD